jgi:nucleoside-diphosphate-sugar epimerase
MQIDDGRVVSNFIVHALKNIDLTVYGDGEQTRSFCYVDDLIKGIVKLMDVEYKKPINLGNPGEYKVADLAKMIIKTLGAQSKIKFEPLPQDDPKRRRPDISLAKKLLNWQPEIKVEEGIKKTANYFQEQLKIK